jgi:hypothetical protein
MAAEMLGGVEVGGGCRDWSEGGSAVVDPDLLARQLYGGATTPAPASSAVAATAAAGVEADATESNKKPFSYGALTAEAVRDARAGWMPTRLLCSLR